MTSTTGAIPIGAERDVIVFAQLIFVCMATGAGLRIAARAGVGACAGIAAAVAILAGGPAVRCHPAGVVGGRVEILRRYPYPGAMTGVALSRCWDPIVYIASWPVPNAIQTSNYQVATATGSNDSSVTK